MRFIAARFAQIGRRFVGAPAVYGAPGRRKKERTKLCVSLFSFKLPQLVFGAGHLFTWPTEVSRRIEISAKSPARLLPARVLRPLAPPSGGSAGCAAEERLVFLFCFCFYLLACVDFLSLSLSFLRAARLVRR